MRLREDDTLDPRVERELAAVEAALAGEAVDPDLADLAELAAALEEMRATPAEEFAAELDLRAAAGFVGERGLPGAGLWERFRSVPLTRRLVPAGATALAAVVVATAVVAMPDLGSDDSATTPMTALEEAGPQPSTPAAAQPAPAVAESAGTGEIRRARAGGFLSTATSGGGSGTDIAADSDTGPFAAGERRRFVERSAELTLGTEPEEVQRVADDVFGVVGRYEGIVLSSSIEEGAEGRAGAEFSLLVPSDRLSDALADLSAIAEVRSREENAQDITAPVVTVGERLRDARAEVEGLLKQLAEADTDEERAAVKAQLAFQRQRVASLRARKNALERRANFSRVSLEIVTGEASSFGDEDEGAWTIGDAVDDAGRILGVAAGVTLVGLAVIAPFALLLGLALLGRRVWVRQGRERALEG
jgi:hypothetical protein